MIIPGTNYTITKSVNGQIFHNFTDTNVFVSMDPNDTAAINAAETLITALKTPKKLMSQAQLDSLFNRVKDIIVNGSNAAGPIPTMDFNTKQDSRNYANSTVRDQAPATQPKVNLEKLAQRVMDFFSEFHFAVNYRFINTMYWQCVQGTVVEYITNYFKTTNSQYTNSIVEKMKSAEFRDIVSIFKTLPPFDTQINKRFKLYFGAPGSGKTQAIEQEADYQMGCHSGLIASELMEVFDFNDENGNPVFTPTVLQKAMVEGKKIHLEEINLLPFESLRYLQILLDNKDKVELKSKTIHVKEGFQVIASMNLEIDDCVYALPTPLIDRACEIKEFVLTAADLAKVLH